MRDIWSKEKAWAWYNSKPWLRGCNFMPSNCVNIVEMWQEEGFETVLATADKELALAASTGMNSIRIHFEFIVWQQQHDGFMQRLDRFLQVAWKHGIACMLTLGNDCLSPLDPHFEQPHLGKQKCEFGYHGAVNTSIFSNIDMGRMVGYSPLDNEETAPQYFEMIRELIETHKNDERVIVWDLYNEPGNSNRLSMTIPNLKKIFEIAREIDPIQPLTACVWCGWNPEGWSEVERFALEQSDIISYHLYENFEAQVKEIQELRRYGRPILNTEWLARTFGCTIQNILPLFYLEKIGCWNWGLVAGRYQSFEPWASAFEQYEKNPNLKYDFTKWFHDLYRPSFRPYDPDEIRIFQEYTARADKEFLEQRAAD